MKNKMLIFISVILLFSITACSQVESMMNGMKLISNDFVTYEFYVPNAWIVVSDDSTGYIGAYYSENDRSNITVTAFETEGEFTSLDEFWESYEADFNGTFTDMEYQTQSQITLDGFGANCYEYKATVTGDEYRFMQVVSIRAETVYIITYTAAPDKYETHLDEVSDMIAFFKFK